MHTPILADKDLMKYSVAYVANADKVVKDPARDEWERKKKVSIAKQQES